MIEKIIYNFSIFSKKILEFYSLIESDILNNEYLKNLETIDNNKNIKIIKNEIIKIKKEHKCDFCDRIINTNEVSKLNTIVNKKNNKIQDIYLCVGCLMVIFFIQLNRTKNIK